VFFTADLFCQDVIVKKDSTKIEAKLLEVKPNEIKYKVFYYQDGPIHVIDKSEVAYVKYSNGTSDVFNDTNEQAGNIKTDTIYIDEKQLKDTVKTGDYMKFNIQAAIVVYNSFSNVPRENRLEMTSSDEYRYVSTKQNITFNLGFNFLFGKSPYVKHVIGVNYLKTKSEFYNNYGSIGYSSNARYRSDVDFVNVVTGLRFSLFKKLHLEPLVTVNFVANSKTTRSGTETSFDRQTPPYTKYTTSFENEPIHTIVENTISFTPKISYEIPVKKIKMEAYAAYNFALQYRLPWYQFGVYIFPFKKLR
jgi:hypothetical protein